MYPVKSAIIQISAIHDVEGSCLVDQLIQDVYVVSLGRGYDDNAGDVALQVQQGVKLDSAFGSSELGPWKQGKTQIDGRGVQSVCGLNKIDSKAVARIQNLSTLDQDLSEVSKNSPIPAFVGIRKGALGDISDFGYLKWPTLTV